MKLLLIVCCGLISACSNGNMYLGKFDHERRFKCDMDPYMQQCATPRELDAYRTERK